MNDDDEIIEDEDESPPIQNDDGFASALLDASANFDLSLKTKFKPTEYTALRTIGAFIMRGLSLEESCILARVDKEKLDAIRKLNEDVDRFIVFKQIAYKAALLDTLSASATSGRQAKSAGYLLEKKYPKEFDPKKGDDDVRDKDVVERAIEYVRQTSERHPLVKRLPAPQK